MPGGSETSDGPGSFSNALPTSDPTIRVAPSSDRADDEVTVEDPKDEETAIAAEAQTIDRLREESTAPHPRSPAKKKGKLPVVGDIVNGRWRIERSLDSGGMAHVFEAIDTEGSGRAAIKLMDPRLAFDKHARERFSREAHVMLLLRNEHTVRVLDFGFHKDETPFLVMEYLEGKDLARILEESGPLTIGDGCLYIAQACEALEEAHAAGIVHRDLKPKNLFLTKKDGASSIRVLDFGIARGTGGVVGKLSTITLVGDVVGTLSYMSPEQARNASSADVRSDIWALGACLYRVLTQKLPFAGSSVIESILRAPPTPIKKHRRDVPQTVEQIILRCLEKDPKARFQSARELREALLEARGEEDTLHAPWGEQRAKVPSVIDGETTHRLKLTKEDVDLEETQRRSHGENPATPPTDDDDLETAVQPRRRAEGVAPPAPAPAPAMQVVPTPVDLEHERAPVIAISPASLVQGTAPFAFAPTVPQPQYPGQHPPPRQPPTMPEHVRQRAAETAPALRSLPPSPRKRRTENRGPSKALIAFIIFALFTFLTSLAITIFVLVSG